MKLARIAVLAILAVPTLAVAQNVPKPTCDPSDPSCNDMDHGCSGKACNLVPAPKHHARKAHA